jgi:hypothetical protein
MKARLAAAGTVTTVVAPEEEVSSGNMHAVEASAPMAEVLVLLQHRACPDAAICIYATSSFMKDSQVDRPLVPAA